jgi:hypothetical protein
MPGVLNVSEYFSYSKVARGPDSPPQYICSTGLNNRIGVSGSFSYARSQFEESRINALGDSALAVKFLLLREGSRRRQCRYGR